MSRRRPEKAFSAQNVPQRVAINGRPLELCKICSTDREFIYHTEEDDPHAKPAD